MSKTVRTNSSLPAEQVTSFEGNGTLFQYSVVIAAVAVLAALTIPFIAQESEMLQANSHDGIDRIVTGSINKEPRRYRVRRSILDAAQSK